MYVVDDVSKVSMTCQSDAVTSARCSRPLCSLLEALWALCEWICRLVGGGAGVVFCCSSIAVLEARSDSQPSSGKPHVLAVIGC